VIYLDQGVINQFVLTLSEVTTVTTPHYLFVFTNEMNTTSTPQLFTSADTSAYPERYNLFTLDEPTDIALLKGQYVYQVYESSTAQTTGVVIEEGRMVVSGPAGTSIYD